MMTLYKDSVQLPKTERIYKSRGVMYSDEVLCFDIEATSLFDIEGEFKPYDYSRPKEYYIGKEKKALPYIWQFSFNDEVFYSNEFFTFGNLLEGLHEQAKDVHHYIYCHNLSYDCHFLFNIIKKNGWHLSGVIARGIRKVIQFHIDELNITFRCSYALTNLGLARAGEHFNCEHAKMVGDLDYHIPRSPNSVASMTKEEFGYCENDLRVMFDFLSGHFLERYKHIKNIPLTQTGEVRKEMNGHVSYWYHRKIWDNIPDTKMYMMLMESFMGGVTHANFIHAGKVLDRVSSYDYASSYPFRMVTCKFPVGDWFPIQPHEIEYFESEECAMIYHVRIHNFKSRFFNHYIPSSKALDKQGCRFDNGRIIEGTSCELFITSVDWEIIRKSYDIGKVDYLEIQCSHTAYLEKDVILYILEQYGRKTSLKNIEGQEDIYMKAKQCINSLYGISVYNPLKQNYTFDLYGEENEEGKLWETPPLNLDFIEDKLDAMKSSWSILFQYSTGCFVTSYARLGLWQLVTGCFGEVDKDADRDSVYYDTDSNKFLNPEKHTALVDYINRQSEEAIQKVCEYYDIAPELFSPLDKKGIPHPIGRLEYEDTFAFKTLGAKKYMCCDDEGNYSITVSGVPKSGVKYMTNGFDSFEKGFEFPYECGKLNMVYEEEQTPFTFIDNTGNPYTCDDIQFAIIAQPTTYTLGITDEYEALLEMIEHDIFF